MGLNRVKSCGRVLLFLLALIFSSGISHAGPFDVWHWVNPLPQGNSLLSVAYGNGIFVAAGTSGTILTSVDGISWTSRELLPTIPPFSSLTFGNGVFVGVAEGIFTTPDGVVWTPRDSKSSPSNQDFYDVTFGNGLFVAVGGGGKIRTSSNGIDWIIADLETTGELTDVAYGNGTFVAAGYGFEGKIILTSLDGVAWTSQPSAAAFCPELPSWSGISEVAFGNGIFVAAGHCGTVSTSPDGVNWTVQTSLSTPIERIAFGNDIFVGFRNVGGEGTFPPFSSIVVSSDGINWTSITLEIDCSLSAIVYGNGVFVAVGINGAILTSNDGTNWSARFSTMTNANLGGLAYGGGMWVAVGHEFNGPMFSAATIFSSTDGVHWSGQPSGIGGDLGNVAYGNGNFVITGYNGTILTSSDGVSWTTRNSGTTDPMNVSYINGVFVAISSTGLLASTDGVVWDRWGTIPGTTRVNDITYGNGKYLTGGHVCHEVIPIPPDYPFQVCNVQISISTDLIHWTNTELSIGSSSWGESSFSDFISVTYGNGIFVGVGYSRNDGTYTIYTSADGIEWTPGINAVSGVTTVAFGNGTFVAVGLGGIATSIDGAIWTARSPRAFLNNVAFGAGKFVAVGGSGTILQSAPMILDVPAGHWAEAFITTLYNSAITGGCGNGNFCPNDPVTRAQMAVFLISTVYGGEPVCNGGLLCKDTTSYFTDVPSNHWAFKFIQKMAEVGITGGCSATEFCPGTNVMRMEMAVFITAALSALPQQTQTPVAQAFNGIPGICTGFLFSDVNSWTVGENFCRFIEDFSTLGITGGCQADDPSTLFLNEARYCWDQDVTRAQMAVFLGRAFLGM